MSARVKVLIGYTAQARWLATVTDEHGRPLHGAPEITRPADLPREPYHYSQEITTYLDPHGRSVVCLETGQRRFEVWTVAIPDGCV